MKNWGLLMNHKDNPKTVYSSYPELLRVDIRTSWNKKSMYRMGKAGFKYCRMCKLMIRINELFCRVCGKRFAYIPNMFTKKASIVKPEYVYLQRSKVTKFGCSLLW